VHGCLTDKLYAVLCSKTVMREERSLLNFLYILFLKSVSHLLSYCTLPELVTVQNLDEMKREAGGGIQSMNTIMHAVDTLYTRLSLLECHFRMVIISYLHQQKGPGRRRDIIYFIRRVIYYCVGTYFFFLNQKNRLVFLP
jgi:hypothetical protein